MALLHGLPLSETILGPSRIARHARVVRGEEAEAWSVIRRFGIIGRPDQPPSSLSGGNQQKAILGRWLHLGPRLLLLDEPTRGVDVRSKAEIHRLIQQQASEGAAVVLVSSEIQELVALCDRVCVLSNGHIARILAGDEITESSVVEAMTAQLANHLQGRAVQVRPGRSTGANA
jgi:simple sugar transport system ATP-binding protein